MLFKSSSSSLCTAHLLSKSKCPRRPIKKLPENVNAVDGNNEAVVTSKSSKKRNRHKNRNREDKEENNTEAMQDESNLLSNLSSPISTISIKDLKAAMEVFSLSQKPAKTPEEALKKSYQFWNTQPVPRMDEKITVNEAIEPDKDLSEIRAEPYSLPDGFMWDTLNLEEPLVLKELYTLLNENYVEDDDSMFGLIINRRLYNPQDGKETGTVGSESTQRMVEINFLCVHKKLRSKRVAPVLIREITRRVHLNGLFQAVYT
ncbi:hypothetical protein NQ317_001732, partial [Molorchus minor]